MASSEQTKWLPPRPQSPAAGYALAALSVATALTAAYGFLHFDLPLPFTAFALCAIAVTFRFGGIGPGIFAALGSVVARTFFFEADVNFVSRLVYDLVFLIFAILMVEATRTRLELETRVADRTADLTRANDELTLEIAERTRAEETLRKNEAYLRQVQAEFARVTRLTTMGELTASLAHEVNQPIAAAVTAANTCQRWLIRDTPDIPEAREAAARVVSAATRAADIVSRIRLLFKKGPPQREQVDLNEVIREMVALLRGETDRYRVAVETELAADLPRLLADRVQVQQVLMNLMINGVDAMRDADGPRKLVITSRRADREVMLSVSDTGAGLPAEHGQQIFEAFFTTKDHGTGMGLSISRSIVQSHGGRLWAGDNVPRGASFHITLPISVEAHEGPAGTRAHRLHP
jgi:C4-dicarboxylate-specific signal transduction histidine kinase